mmetsp:Transcript_33500/g.77261  ORF Transcript_33500/g.77261 Transcript_33500/m.77261 type:complete len:245 (-) Transcript_33500:992-1726(-)
MLSRREPVVLCSWPSTVFEQERRRRRYHRRTIRTWGRPDGSSDIRALRGRRQEGLRAEAAAVQVRHNRRPERPEPRDDPVPLLRMPRPRHRLRRNPGRVHVRGDGHHRNGRFDGPLRRCLRAVLRTAGPAHRTHGTESGFLGLPGPARPAAVAAVSAALRLDGILDGRYIACGGAHLSVQSGQVPHRFHRRDFLRPDQHDLSRRGRAGGGADFFLTHVHGYQGSPDTSMRQHHVHHVYYPQRVQ